MSELIKSSYEQDMLDQPGALEDCASQPMPSALAALDLRSFDRIIFTGMGSSHYATTPLELILARQGIPVWRLDTARLLDTPEMITRRTLLWVTSQSGRSGEVVSLMARLPRGGEAVVVATTNDPTSPLATDADHVLLLHSGEEATVSSKSYLNTLAMLHRMGAKLEGRDDADAVAEILRVASGLRARLGAPPSILDLLAKDALAGPRPRFALVGSDADAATALTGALILKEAAKVAAEGYVGGGFRHGPMELAGPGLTLLLFATGTEKDATFRRLAADLDGSGTRLVVVSPLPFMNADHVMVPHGSIFERLCHAMVFVQQFSVSLARGMGLEPGKFSFGQKITSQV